MPLIAIEVEGDEMAVRKALDFDCVRVGLPT